MNGLEAVDVQQREQHLAEALAQRVQRFHQRHAVAQPGQRVARQGGVALAFAFRRQAANSASLRWVMSEIRPRQSDGTSCSLTMVARSSSQR